MRVKIIAIPIVVGNNLKMQNKSVKTYFNFIILSCILYHVHTNYARFVILDLSIYVCCHVLYILYSIFVITIILIDIMYWCMHFEDNRSLPLVVGNPR
jgi:hypothetical protein